MEIKMEVNYENYPIGTKVDSLDDHGYPISEVCGVITEHLGDGHAIIKSFSDNLHYSTVGIRKDRIKEIEVYTKMEPITYHHLTLNQKINEKGNRETKSRAFGTNTKKGMLCFLEMSYDIQLTGYTHLAFFTKNQLLNLFSNGKLRNIKFS